MNSKIQDRLRAIFEGCTPDQMLFLLGDPAYATTYGVASAIKRLPGQELTPHQQQYNTNLPNVRIAVEQGFGNLAMRFPLISEGKARPGYQPVGCYFMVAAFLANCMNCVRRNVNAQRFDLDPPTLEDYVASAYKVVAADELESAEQAIVLNSELQAPDDNAEVEESVEVE